MILDPFDQKIAVDHHGRLHKAISNGTDAAGNPIPTWVPLQMIEFEDFRRPEW